MLPDLDFYFLILFFTICSVTELLYECVCMCEWICKYACDVSSLLTVYKVPYKKLKLN